MNIGTIVDILSWLSFISGGFFLFVGSLGMVRLGDFWARLHAASVIDSAGIGLILLGFLLQSGFSLVAVKIIIIVVFLFITGPTASHAVANAAFVSGSRPADLVEDATEPKPIKKRKKRTNLKSGPKPARGKA